MVLLKRAWYAIKGRKDKSGVFFVVIFLVTTASIFSVNVRGLIQNNIENMKQDVYSYFTIHTQYEKRLPLAASEHIATLPEIRAYDFQLIRRFRVYNLVPVGNFAPVGSENDEVVINEFNFLGTESLPFSIQNHDTDLVAQLPEVTDMLPEHAVLVSQALATANNLHVGDTITLTGLPIPDVTLLVSGIYQHKYEEGANTQIFENEMYIPNKTMLQLLQLDREVVHYHLHYALTDVSSYEQVKEKILALGYGLIDDDFDFEDNGYQKIISPLLSIQGVFFIIMVVSFLIAVLVFSLAIRIFVTARSKELVIYEMLGSKMSQVILSLVIEYGLLTLFAMLCGEVLAEILVRNIAITGVDVANFNFSTTFKMLSVLYIINLCIIAINILSLYLKYHKHSLVERNRMG